MIRKSGGLAPLAKIAEAPGVTALFLVDVMKFDGAEVHEETEILAHSISERLVDRIDEMPRLFRIPTTGSPGDLQFSHKVAELWVLLVKRKSES